MDAPLLDAAYALVASALFAFVAVRVARRHVERDARRALAAFSLWWYGVALFLALGAVLSVLDEIGATARPAVLAVSALSMLSVCAAVWGLVYYVSYLYTGRSSAFYPAMAFYAAIFVVMVYAIASDASGVEANAWRRSVVRLAILTGPLLTGAIVSFLLPALAALIGYARLYRRVASREQRYRIGLATTSLISWFGLAILARAAGVEDTSSWTVVGRVLALLAALGVLLAYAPPGWLARRLRLDAAPFAA